MKTAMSAYGAWDKIDRSASGGDKDVKLPNTSHLSPGTELQPLISSSGDPIRRLGSLHDLFRPPSANHGGDQRPGSSGERSGYSTVVGSTKMLPTQEIRIDSMQGGVTAEDRRAVAAVRYLRSSEKWSVLKVALLQLSLGALSGVLMFAFFPENPALAPVALFVTVAVGHLFRRARGAANRLTDENISLFSLPVGDKKETLAPHIVAAGSTESASAMTMSER